METLLTKLKLTSISSSNEIIGYKTFKLQQLTTGNNYAACIDEDIEVDVSCQSDEDDCIAPNIWDGECS